jgi:hypothetical protein
MKAPVSGPTHKGEHLYQAEAFVALLSRLDPSVDPDSAFMWWCDSKDFQSRDRQAIAGVVRRLLSAMEAEGDQVHREAHTQAHPQMRRRGWVNKT